MLNRTAKILDLARSHDEDCITEKRETYHIYEFEEHDSSSDTEYISPSVSSECGSENLEIDKCVTRDFKKNMLMKTSDTNFFDDKEIVQVCEESPTLPIVEKINCNLQSWSSAENILNMEASCLNKEKESDNLFGNETLEENHCPFDEKGECSQVAPKIPYPESDNLSNQSESKTSGSEYSPSDDYTDSSSLSETASELKLVTEKEDYLVPRVEKNTEVNNAKDNLKITEISIQFANDPQKDMCPFCYDEVSHFARHLMRNHSDEESVKKIVQLPARCAERRNAIIMLRRKGNFVLQTEKNILKPVRKPVGMNKENIVDNVNYSTCKHCYGLIKSSYLWRHRKSCRASTENLMKGHKYRSESQTLLVSTGLLGNFLNKSRLKEVMTVMRADDIGYIARTDPLICLYGESLVGKHKRAQMLVVVSQKMRRMAKLLDSLRKSTTFLKFLDVLKPEAYNYILASAKVITGFHADTMSFDSPSVALQLGTELKQLCQVAKKAITIKDPLIGHIENTDEKRNEVSQLNEMISSHWCNDIGSLANKVLNENKYIKPKLLPTAEDVSLFNTYTSSLANEAYNRIKSSENIEINYNILVKCTLALLLLFNRRRIGEIQFLDIESYERPPERINQEEMLSCLTDFEKTLCNIFKRVVVFGKGSKPVPILFSKKTQKYTDLLIYIRRTTDIVPKDNKYVFATSGSSRWICGSAAVQKLASQCGAKKPKLLTSTRFRKQIATILQLMSFEKDELHQVAKFMGHTERTHMEFYRLTENTYQTAKVAKILLLMESGKGAQFKGKSLEEITIDDTELLDEINDSDQEHSTEPNQKSDYNEDQSNPLPELGEEDNQQPGPSGNLPELGDEDNDQQPEPSDIQELRNQGKKKQRNILGSKANTLAIKNECKMKGRRKWKPYQKKIVLERFKTHIKKKIPPKKEECLKLITDCPELQITDWVRIKTLVFNTYRDK